VGSAAVSGLPVGRSLILAIGAQNAFVLRQGLRREHVGAGLPACSLSDAPLMTAAVPGLDALSGVLPWPGGAMRLGGAAFLIVCGALRFRAALRGGRGAIADRRPGGSAEAGAGNLPAAGPDQPASRTVLPAPVRP